MEVVSLGAVAIGLINVGSADAEVSSTLLQRLLELTPQKLSSTYSRLKMKIYLSSMYQHNCVIFHCRFLPLALGMIYMGRRDIIEAPSAALEVLPEPYKLAAQTMLEAIFSSLSKYATTLNVLIKRCNLVG